MRQHVGGSCSSKPCEGSGVFQRNTGKHHLGKGVGSKSVDDDVGIKTESILEYTYHSMTYIVLQKF